MQPSGAPELDRERAGPQEGCLMAQRAGALPGCRVKPRLNVVSLLQDELTSDHQTRCKKQALYGS